MTFTVIARRWFERVNGNTYHSCEVYKNGVLLERVAFIYGYGNQWDATGAKIIARHCPRIWKHANTKAHYPMPYASSLARYSKHKVVTSCTDVERKRDL